jgi:pilus assembly protein CpaE
MKDAMDNPNLIGVRAWKPLVACPHMGVADGLRDALRAIGVGEYSQLPDYPCRGSVAALAAQHRSNLLFLDVASDQNHAMAVLAEAVPVLPVIALSPENDADLILRCLRREASEFLFGDVTPGQVQAVLDRVSRMRSPADAKKSGSVCCVVPGKVGCGASTVAAHLALAMHARGAASVLLVDADILSGSISFLFKLKSDFTLENAMRDWGRMDLDVWKRMVIKQSGIDILPAPESISRLEIDRTLAQELAAFCREHYDVAVFDTGGAGVASTHWLAQAADQVLLVATNELAALHSARRAIDRLEGNGLARALVRVVINRYTPSIGFKLTEVASILRVPLYADLANDYEGVRLALLEGRPIKPESRLGQCFASLADRLGGRKPAEHRRSSLLSLFSRRSAISG